MNYALPEPHDVETTPGTLPQPFALPEHVFVNGDAWAEAACVIFCELGVSVDSETGLAEVLR